MPDYTISLTAEQDEALDAKVLGGAKTKAEYVQSVLDNLTNGLLSTKYGQWFSSQPQAAKKVAYDAGQ